MSEAVLDRPAAEAIPPEAKGSLSYDASQVVIFSGKARRMLADAQEFVIDSPELYQAAAEDLQAVKTLAARVEETRVSITGPLHQAKVAVDALFKAPKDFLAQAESKLKTVMLRYDDEQERIREAERRRVQELERQERERLAAIERKQQAEAREREEKARAAEAEARRLEEEAQRLAAAGDEKAAAEVQERASEKLSEAESEASAAHIATGEADATAQTAATFSIAPATPEPVRVSGISTSKTVDFEVTDLYELVCHIAKPENKHLIGLLNADSVKLRNQVRATGMQTVLPGVRVFQKKTLSSRGA